jgi:hypothetical protein
MQSVKKNTLENSAFYVKYQATDSENPLRCLQCNATNGIDMYQSQTINVLDILDSSCQTPEIIQSIRLSCFESCPNIQIQIEISDRMVIQWKYTYNKDVNIKLFSIELHPIEFNFEEWMDGIIEHNHRVLKQSKETNEYLLNLQTEHEELLSSFEKAADDRQEWERILYQKVRLIDVS